MSNILRSTRSEKNWHITATSVLKNEKIIEKVIKPRVKQQRSVGYFVGYRF